MTPPQFGEPQPGRAYPDRPAAFAIVAREGRIAIVRVSFEKGGGRTDLPGGGIDPAESEAQAAIREVGEEAGLLIAPGRQIARADHYFINEEDHAVNTRGVFFEGRLIREAPELRTEADHALVWMEPAEALRELDREAHVWALACWMRRDRP